MVTLDSCAFDHNILISRFRSTQELTDVFKSFLWVGAKIAERSLHWQTVFNVQEMQHEIPFHCTALLDFDNLCLALLVCSFPKKKN